MSGDYEERRAQLIADMREHAAVTAAREAHLRAVLGLGCALTLLVVVLGGALWLS